MMVLDNPSSPADTAPMQIPAHIPKLIYTKHALSERCKEPLGFIAAAPTTFYRIGCKECFPTGPGQFRAIYIYDDEHDLHLAISHDGYVITNFLKRASNKGVYKGRFRIGRTA